VKNLAWASVLSLDSIRWAETDVDVANALLLEERAPCNEGPFMSQAVEGAERPRNSGLLQRRSQVVTAEPRRVNRKLRAYERPDG
jgi:hypothetical protein